MCGENCIAVLIRLAFRSRITCWMQRVVIAGAVSLRGFCSPVMDDDLFTRKLRHGNAGLASRMIQDEPFTIGGFSMKCL